MERGVSRSRSGERVREDRVLRERAVLDRAVDPGQILIHDAAGPEVQVAHLGVSHLPAREAHGLPPRDEGRVRARAHERVHHGRARHEDGVPFRARIETPAVEDDQPRQRHRGARHGARLAQSVRVRPS